jgi:hypothetical protein
MSTLLFCIGLVVASTLVSGALAFVWAKNRKWVGYVISTLAVWIGLSTMPLFTPSWAASRFPVDFAHFLSTMISLAPLV